MNIGKVLDPQHMLLMKKCGQCEGPNGSYELFIDQAGQPLVISDLTKRKFHLKWEHIVELAVNSGVDDRVVKDETIPKHYHMQCQSGHFSDEGFMSLPFVETKQ